MTIKEVYEKYKHLDELFGDKDFMTVEVSDDQETKETEALAANYATALHHCWCAIKNEF